MDNNLDNVNKEDKELSKHFNFFSLMKFVFPSIFTFVFIAFYQTVDGFFIEKYVGELAIGAVNLYMPLLYLFVAIGVMLGTGANAIIVKKIGEGKTDEASKSFSNTILFALILSVVLTIFCLVFQEPIMHLCGATSGNIGYLKEYYVIMTSFSITIMLQSALGILIIGEGKSVTAALVIMIGGVINCVLDYIFMKHLHLGIKGAALATVIGYSSTIIFAFFYYIIAKRSKYTIKFTKLNLREIGVISFNGSSDMISNLAGAVTTMIMNHIAGKYYGEIGVSSLSIVFYLQFFIEAIYMGFTSAVEPVFSYHYGSGNVSERKNVFKLSNIWIFLISILIMAIVFIFNDEIVSIFFKEGTEIYNITKLGLNISILATIFCGYNTFYSGLFTAFSNGIVSGFLSVIRSLVILVICLFGLSYLFKGIGLWISWPTAEALALIISIIFIIKYKKKYNYL